jgi:hypothetical protein
LGGLADVDLDSLITSQKVQCLSWDRQSWNIVWL